MSSNELPPEDGADRPEQLPFDDAVSAEAWDAPEQADSEVDDGAVLRDGSDATVDDAIGELAEEPADRFSSFEAADDADADAELVADIPARELESIYRASAADVWATRPTREAEIMGHAEVSDDDAARGRDEAACAINAKLSGVYEVAASLQQTSGGEVEDPGMSEAPDGTRTWYTESGNVSIRRESVVANDNAIRQRVMGLEGVELQEGTLHVQAQRFVPYNEAGDRVEVNVRLRFDTERDRVYWKDLSTGFTNPADGSPCPEGEEALLGQFTPEELPPGVTMEQAIEERLLSYVWGNTQEAFRYASQGYMAASESYDAAADPAVIASDELAAEIEAEQALAAEAAEGPSVRDLAFASANEQLLAYEQSDSTDFQVYTASSAYWNLIELAGQSGNADLVAGLIEKLEAMKDVPASDLIEAYFVGSDAGDPEMLAKIDNLLTSEMIHRMKEGSELPRFSEMSGLHQAVREYEARGIAPDTLIADKTLSMEERWLTTVHHYSRTQETDAGAAQGLRHAMRQLARNEGGTFTPAFIVDVTPQMLYLCQDTAMQAELVEQFTSAIDRMPVTRNSLRALQNVGDHVLQNKELTQLGLAQQIKMIKDMQTEQITDYWAVRSSREWDVKFLTHTDLPVQEVIAGIKDSTARSIANAANDETRQALAVDDGGLMQAGAWEYAKQGKFAHSQALLAEMGMGMRADAYEACLGYARSAWDIQRLRPAVDAEVQVFDPDIDLLFETAAVRIGTDVQAMGTQVEKLADIIARTSEDDEESTLPDPYRTRNQAVALLNRMKAVQPGSEIQATKALLRGMQRSAWYGTELSTMSYSFDSLMNSSDAADHAFVYGIIRDTDGTPAEKASLFSKLASKLSK